MNTIKTNKPQQHFPQKRNFTNPNQEKKIGQLKKYPNQPVVGFRYVGMSWSSYFEGDQQPQKLSKKKDWGAGMAVDNTGSGLARWVLLQRYLPSLGSRYVNCTGTIHRSIRAPDGANCEHTNINLREILINRQQLNQNPPET